MATIKGTTPPAFGINNAGAAAEFDSGVLTQSISVSEKVERKEGRNAIGDVKWLAFYGEKADITIEVLGTPSTALMAALTLPAAVTTNSIGSGKFFCEEISTDRSNEDFVKTSIRGTAYKLITTT